ncbi:MAG: hypothetical protein E7046_06050 [Lentisphaerae bacterium]|nr:hypothetical protein [Lentisphaerota bacterium]
MSKMFTIKASEAHGRRLDPLFHSPTFRMNRLCIESHRYLAMKGLCELSNETWDKAQCFQDCFPYVEIGAINCENGEIGGIEELVTAEAPSRAQMVVRAGDLLVSATRPTRNAIAIVPLDVEKAIASTGFLVVRGVQSTLVTPKYLFHVLRMEFCTKQFDQYSSGGNYPAITKDDFRKIIIPLPPLPEQRKIVAELDAAYAAKRAADEKATKLLSSIDEMVLKELGIAKLPKPDTSLSSRIFTVPAREVHNGRLDAYYYKGNFKELNKKLSCCNCVPFGRLITEIYNGIDCRDYKESGVPYLKVANVKPGEFDFDDLKYIDSQEVGAKDIALRAGRMLLTRKGTFGNAIALSEDYDYAISSEVFCLSIKNELVDVHYLETFVNSSIGRMLCDKYKIGAIMGSLSQEAVKALPIPLPDAKVQYRIASRASSIRAEARKLKADATAALDAAKRGIEMEIVRER